MLTAVLVVTIVVVGLWLLTDNDGPDDFWQGL